MIFAKKLTKKEIDALPDFDFGVIQEKEGKKIRRLPLHDKLHVQMAQRMLSRVKDITSLEKEELRTRINEKAKEFGIGISLAASSIFAVGDEEHPNKMPFLGLLCYLDEPSENPPSGANGKRVLLPSDVADDRIHTLEGTGVNVDWGYYGHDVKKKIGCIESTWSDEGHVFVYGHLWCRDFPEECNYIKDNASKLGMSYETTDTQLSTTEQDDVLKIDKITFTGAAILKDWAAAYTNTALAAKAKGEIQMEEKKLLEILEGFKSDIEASIDAKIKPVSEKMEAIEAKAVTEPPKTDAKTEFTDEMKTALEATGKAIEDVVKKIDEVSGKVTALEAKKDEPPAEPQRKTVPAELLAKWGKDLEGKEGQDLYAAIDKLPVDNVQKMSLKLAVMTAPQKAE